MASGRLLHGSPTGGHPHVQYVINQDRLRQEAKSFTHKGFTMIPGVTHQARNELINLAISIKAEYLVMHDDDMEFEPVAGRVFDKDGKVEVPGIPALDLMRQVLDNYPNAITVGAVYIQGAPEIPAVRMVHPEYPEWTEKNGKPVPPEMTYVLQGYPEHPVSVQAIGTGLTMFRVAHLVEMAKRDTSAPWFNYGIYGDRFSDKLSCVTEDIDFCVRAKRLGFDIIAEPRIRNVHFKMQGMLAWDRSKWNARVDLYEGENPKVKLKDGVLVRPGDGFLYYDLTPKNKEQPEARPTLVSVPLSV